MTELTARDQALIEFTGKKATPERVKDASETGVEFAAESGQMVPVVGSSKRAVDRIYLVESVVDHIFSLSENRVKLNYSDKKISELEEEYAAADGVWKDVKGAQIAGSMVNRIKKLATENIKLKEQQERVGALLTESGFDLADLSKQAEALREKITRYSEFADHCKNDTLFVCRSNPDVAFSRRHEHKDTKAEMAAKSYNPRWKEYATRAPNKKIGGLITTVEELINTPENLAAEKKLFAAAVARKITKGDSFIENISYDGDAHTWQTVLQASAEREVTAMTLNLKRIEGYLKNETTIDYNNSTQEAAGEKAKEYGKHMAQRVRADRDGNIPMLIDRLVSVGKGDISFYQNYAKEIGESMGNILTYGKLMIKMAEGNDTIVKAVKHFVRSAQMVVGIPSREENAFEHANSNYMVSSKTLASILKGHNKKTDLIRGAMYGIVECVDFRKANPISTQMVVDKYNSLNASARSH